MTVKFSVIFTVLLQLLLKSSTEQPNIVFILADDFGWNDVSFHGSQQVRTPTLQRLADEGLILNNYYTSPWCTPSRSALMTGRHAVEVGLQYFVIDAGQRLAVPLSFKMMPQYLNDLGYECHAAGKWHLGFFHRKLVFDQL